MKHSEICQTGVELGFLWQIKKPQISKLKLWNFPSVFLVQWTAADFFGNPGREKIEISPTFLQQAAKKSEEKNRAKKEKKKENPRFELGKKKYVSRSSLRGRGVKVSSKKRGERECVGVFVSKKK